jgi:trimeric autotransporter adhesin
MKQSLRATWIGACLVGLVLTVGLGSAPGSSTAKGPKQFDQALLKELRDSAHGSVTVSIKKGTGFASFLRVGLNGDLYPAGKGGSPEGKARGFLRKFSPLLGASGADAELVQVAKTTDRLGATHVSYEQVYAGLPVFGGTVRVHVDAAGNLTAVNGLVAPDIEVDPQAKLSPEDAAARAITAVAADPPVDVHDNPADVSVVTLQAAKTSLEIYRTGLLRDAEGSNQLAYVVEVTNGGSVRDMVFLSADTGKVVNRYSLVEDALFRRVFEQNLSTQVWQEGDPFPGSLNVDQQNIVTFSGEAYYHFFNAFGRDSYDGLGAEMKIVNNDPRINCPNANWNGITTNYCNGVTADDVVAHEWGHAYTQYTDDLIYQWQPGALNESYSDIWGETVDQLNGIGTDSPSPVRTPNACSTHSVPVPILIINSPTPGTCAAGAAAFGPLLTTVGTTGDLVLALDPADAAGPSTTDACSPLTNAAAVAGKVALLDRGTCTFVVKVKNAQNAGAIAVVVANTLGRPAFGLGGADATITIPSLGISNAHGDLLKGYLSAGLTTNVTLKVKGGVNPPEDSYKWLLAEDATAFNASAPPGGHAIRDMWDPTCIADPGKVTDAEYQCDTSDGGGVHTNSGVPNHGYALLVDGGTYNGRTVTGIGLVKAAHIYWRAQSIYQTKTTDFADHADALEQSCADLIGVPLQGLSVTSTPAGPSGQAIAAADCAEVSDMIAAVELRTEPTQCNFMPLLSQNTPDLCANQKNPPVLYAEDFEDGLTGWTLANAGVYSGWSGTDWAANTSLPGGRSGGAAFAEDLDGQCSGGAGDQSGHMTLTSPAIHLPAASILSPRVTFEQYVATEAGFDGGNLKISVNGGPYTLVPLSAFTFNGYPATLVTSGGGNTNPLAGEPAFTGTDGGQVTGSWAQSQIDLTRVGVKPGDTIQLRFDFGMDGCGAIDGWYVDDVKVRACNTKKGQSSLVVTARHEG